MEINPKQYAIIDEIIRASNPLFFWATVQVIRTSISSYE